jgi:hypothetical protein
MLVEPALLPDVRVDDAERALVGVRRRELVAAVDEAVRGRNARLDDGGDAEDRAADCDDNDETRE